MDRKQPMELTNMCMVYKNGQVLVEEKIIRENEKGIIFPGGHVEPGRITKRFCDSRNERRNRLSNFQSKTLWCERLDSGGWYKVSCTFI